jgi:hypothetical protein
MTKMGCRDRKDPSSDERPDPGRANVKCHPVAAGQRWRRSPDHFLKRAEKLAAQTLSWLRGWLVNVSEQNGLPSQKVSTPLSFAVAVIVILNRNLINYRKQLLEPPFEASSFAGARIRAWSIAADPAQR